MHKSAAYTHCSNNRSPRAFISLSAHDSQLSCSLRSYRQKVNLQLRSVCVAVHNWNPQRGIDIGDSIVTSGPLFVRVIGNLTRKACGPWLYMFKLGGPWRSLAIYIQVQT